MLSKLYPVHSTEQVMSHNNFFWINNDSKLLLSEQVTSRADTCSPLSNVRFDFVVKMVMCVRVYLSGIGSLLQMCVKRLLCSFHVTFIIKCCDLNF